MKFKFKLEKVLQHRKNLEDIAQKDFQEAMAALNAEINKLNEMISAVKKARDEAFKFQSEGGKSSSSLNQVHDFMMGQDLRIERQKEKIKEHESLVENLREILRQRAIDCKIISELKEKKRVEFITEKNKLEQKKSDEQNVMRFGRGEEKT